MNCTPTVKSKRFRDLTGVRFGKLLVLEPTEKRMDEGSVVWRCLCDCGNTAEVSARRLTRGKVRSCGCLSNPPLKDYVGKRFGRLKVVSFSHKERKPRPGKPTSTITYWNCLCDCGKEVVVGQPELQNGDTQSCGCLQRENAAIALGLIDGTSVSVLESGKKKLRMNNTSGYTGVSKAKSGKWETYITFKKKRYRLGYYENIEDAVKARKNAERMHDEFLEWYYETYSAENADTALENQHRVSSR